MYGGERMGLAKCPVPSSSSPGRMATCYCRQRDVGRGMSGEYENQDPLRSFGAVNIMQSDETLEGDRV